MSQLVATIASRLTDNVWRRHFSGTRLTVVALSMVILLAVVLVLAWGDTRAFPKVLDKEMPTRSFTLDVDFQDDLANGHITDDLRSEFAANSAGLSERAMVTVLREGAEWMISAPKNELSVLKEGDKLNVDNGLLIVSSAKYQEELARDTIPGDLREMFRMKSSGLSSDAKVLTLKQEQSWLIIDPSKRYVVKKQHHINVNNMALRIGQETLEDLNIGRISENLMVELRRNEILFASHATVSTLEEGKRWLINDLFLDATHILTKGADRLSIKEIEAREAFLGEDIAGGVDSATEYVTKEGDVLFDSIGDVIRQVLIWLENALLWLPFPVLIIGVAFLAWRTASLWVGLFSAGSLLMIGFVGLWPSAMETLSLMLTSVAISTLIAMPIGIVASRSNAVDAALRPVLDGMQTMPSFVYLVPAIFFFGLGNVPAVIATIIYAVPPCIRLTNLGIRQVSPETLEAASAFGATPLQLLLKVQIPLALPTIMAGINQTTMMALAMVVVASLVGAGGLGEDVLKAIGRLQIGNSLLAGMSIVFLAVIIDRITQGLAKSRAQATQD